MTPLFIPLKAVYFDAFESGEKKHEYRIYGQRWNERACQLGRPVLLSRGYGKHRRLSGMIASFQRLSLSALPDYVQESMRLIYGEQAEQNDIAVIGIDVLHKARNDLASPCTEDHQQ